MKNKILIWGTGSMSSELMKNQVNADVLGFVQTKKTIEEYMNYSVFSIDEMPLEYDYIFVANTYSDEIKVLCHELEIPDEKVVYLYKGKHTNYLINPDIKEILGEANLNRYASQYNVLEDSFFIADMQKYSSKNTRKNFAIREDCLSPILIDKYANAGTVGNYFWQDLWAAKKIINSGVREHFDIGSRLDGFIAHLLASNIDVTMIDVREFPCEIEGLHTVVDDATLLKQLTDESIYSLSALCSLEHFGLGRYGDPVDPEACFICFKNIQRVMKSGGELYLSVTVGAERVEFNAHRVFYASTIADCFDEMYLKEYSCITADGIEYNVDIHKYDLDSHSGEYRFGLFHFVKK